MLILAIAIITPICSAQAQRGVFQYHEIDSPKITEAYFFDGGKFVVTTKLRIKKNGKHKLQIINPKKGIAEIEASYTSKKWFNSEQKIVFDLEALEQDARNEENTIVIVLEIEKEPR